LKLVVQDIIHDGGNKAAVQLKAEGMECKNGLKFPNEYVWWCTFNDDAKITKINAFMDT
jgi:ketosteroid isomerase-like protein